MVTRNLIAVGLSLLASLSLSFIASAKLPALAEARPANEAVDIDEQQAFLVRAKGAITAKEFIERVFCEVEGVRSVNNVRVIGGKRKEELLNAAGISNAENWIAFRCAQNFPAGADVIIRWDSQANTFQAADYLRFKVRSSDWLEFTCLRENKESDCNPLGTMSFNVNNRALDPKDVNRFRLRDDAGKLYRPYGGKDCTSEGEYGCGETIPFTKLPPETRFTLVVPPGLKESGTGTALELRRPITFRTSAYPPLVKFARSFGILERNADPALPITVRSLEPATGGTAAVIRKLRVTSEQDMIRWYSRTAGFQKRDRSADDDDYDGFGDEIKGDDDFRARSLLKGNAQAQTIPLPKPGGAKEFEVVGLPLAEPGLHVIEAESTALGASLLEKKGSMFVRSMALTTNLAVHTKTSSGNAFVWVTRLSDATVVADATVRVRSCKGIEIASGKTDKDGVAKFSFRDGRRSNECPQFIFAQSGDDISFTRSDWTRGIESWRFNLSYEYYDGDYDDDPPRKTQMHTILARNLLRPGETVHMKHFARDKKRFGTGAPDVAKLAKTLAIVNEGSNERSSQNLVWTSRGNAVTELRLPQNAKRGQYRVEIAGRTTARFTVADFRLPVYKSEVSAPNANVVSGDKADVDVRLEFLSGGPASGDTVTVRSRFDSRTWNGFENFEDYSFNPVYDDEENSNRRNRESKQPQGEDQTVALSQAGSARVSLTTPKVEKPHSLVADVEYNDPNGEIYTAQTRLTVWPSSRLIGIKALDWAMSREQLRYEIVTTDVTGKAIDGVAFKVKGTHRTWDAYRKRNIGGFYSYESSERKSDLGVLCEGTTDRSGKFTCTSSVKVSGEVQINAEVADDKGRVSIAGTSLWASNGDDWIFRSESSDRIDLLPEKKRYEPGEKARFQVRMPFREATALVTVEREGVVLSNFVTQLSGKSAAIEVPMREEWAPNAYVSALLVRGRVGEPKPTALIDLAKPAFKLGIANVDVNWQRYSLDVKVTTDKPEYQTRDKAQVKIKVDRANNKRPGDNTEVVVFAIDEALLELQGNTTWKLLDTMMRRRGHDVSTATAQMQVIGKRHFGRKALPPGGSGGRGAGTRELFDTLIFWKADVMTDANGEATVEVPLNDSLTRFRIVAVAERVQQNEADRFGTGEASIRTTRDLQLFSGLPKVMRHGDDFRATVTLRNSTQRALQTEAIAEIDGKALQKREVRIAAGESALISWDVKAAALGAESTWKFDANEKGQSRGDSLRVKQALQTPLPIRTVADATAEIKGKASITLKPDVGLTMATGSIKDGELLVSLARVYGADTSGIRGYFARYPFACLEQRTTKALGLKDEGLWSIVSESLPTYLSSNGLANYYPGATEEGYPVLTAFVLSGAHEAGWKIPDETLNKMLYGLERYVSGDVKAQRSWLPNDSVYLLSEKLIVLEALSRYGRASKRLLDTVRVDPVKLTVASLADWIDILNRTKDLPNRDVLRAAAIKELRDQIRVTGSVANVTRADNRWYFMRSEDYSVARMFRLSLDTPEFSQFKTPLLRQLNSRMLRSGHFWSTQANIWAAFALERHAKQASADGRTRVTFRGETKEAVWDANVLDQEVKFAWNGAAAQAGEIAIEHLGKGEPWARAQLRAAVPLTGTQNNGIALSKTIVPVQQKTKGKYSVGDVLQVTVSAANTADLGWLAIDDPVPTGATVLGGLSKLGNVGEAAQTWQGYRYIERTFTNVRSSFEYATKGKHSFTYELRLTTPGKFALPPTHAEAMYAPEVNGQLGNAVFEIEP